MITELSILIAVAVAIVGFIAWQYLRRGTKNDLGIDGKLIWVDEGRGTKPFFNPEFRVFGKPDLIYQVRGGLIAVEYKSRHGPIFDSDVIQALCAALAARGEGLKVTEVLVKTAAVHKKLVLPRSDKELFAWIKDAVALGRLAKQGKPVPSLPGLRKCRACAYKHDCPAAAN